MDNSSNCVTSFVNVLLPEPSTLTLTNGSGSRKRSRLARDRAHNTVTRIFWWLRTVITGPVDKTDRWLWPTGCGETAGFRLFPGRPFKFLLFMLSEASRGVGILRTGVESEVVWAVMEDMVEGIRKKAVLNCHTNSSSIAPSFLLSELDYHLTLIRSSFHITNCQFIQLYLKVIDLWDFTYLGVRFLLLYWLKLVSTIMHLYVCCSGSSNVQILNLIYFYAQYPYTFITFQFFISSWAINKT